MQRHYECDTEVDLCYSSPCGHYGTCMPKEGGYTCLCMPGYTGEIYREGARGYVCWGIQVRYTGGVQVPLYAGVYS